MAEKKPKLEHLKTSDLIPYARNARTHSPEQVTQIAASIKEFGFMGAVIIDKENGIIAGHGRVLAAQKLGIEQVPCLRYEHLTETQKRAYVLADNKLTLNGGWDDEMLKVELAELKAADFDVELIGFDEEEITELTAPGELTQGDPDAVPELQPEAISKRGEIYELGVHRLMCGDSTSAEDVARLMDGKKADLCLTDPPYGLGDTKSDKNEYADYDDTKENLKKLIAGFFPLAEKTARVVVLTPGNANQLLYPASTWRMAWFVPAGTGRGPWGFCCWQPILCFGKDPKLSKGMGSHPDAIVHSESSEKLGHPCTKPINFWCWLMERTSESGEIIYEPFSGSGTTLIAAAKLNRICYGMEISPQYCDVIRRRWTKYAKDNGIEPGSGALE